MKRDILELWWRAQGRISGAIVTAWIGSLAMFGEAIAQNSQGTRSTAAPRFGPATTQPAYSIFSQAPWWLLVGLAIVGIVLFVIAFKWARAWVKGDSDGYENFTISQLRDLRDQGVITSSEYDRAKTAIAARELNAIRDKDS